MSTVTRTTISVDDEKPSAFIAALAAMDPKALFPALQPAPAVERELTARERAEEAAARLLGDVRDLRRGTGVFAVLSPVERAEQLAALLDEPVDRLLSDIAGIPTDAERREIEDREECYAREATMDAERWDGQS